MAKHRIVVQVLSVQRSEGKDSAVRPIIIYNKKEPFLWAGRTIIRFADQDNALSLSKLRPFVGLEIAWKIMERASNERYNFEQTVNIFREAQPENLWKNMKNRPGRFQSQVTRIGWAILLFFILFSVASLFYGDPV